MADAADITDLTRGVYRRQYAGYGTGRRINAVSIQAEAWFWRIHSIAADDFGNTPGDPDLVYMTTVGRRRGVSVTDVAGWVEELERADLLRSYEVDGERFIHVVGFVARQPAGKNGKRVKRCPSSPWDSDEVSASAETSGESKGIRVNPGESKPSDNVGRVGKRNAIGNNGLACDGAGTGESGGIQVNPRESSASHTHTHTQNQDQNQDKPPTEASAPALSGGTEPAPPDPSAPSSKPFLIFPTVAGKKTDAAEWPFTVGHAAELSKVFPGVDVRAQARMALEWVRSKPANRKTAGGMREFLFRWMKREQDKPALPARTFRRNGNHGPPPPPGGGSITQRQVWGET